MLKTRVYLCFFTAIFVYVCFLTAIGVYVCFLTAIGMCVSVYDFFRTPRRVTTTQVLK